MKDKKRVLMVLENYFPPDIRVLKEARTLVKEGFEVYLLCWWKSGSLEKEVIEGINVLRIINPEGFFNKVWGNFIFSLNFTKPVWKKRIDNIVKMNRIDVVHVHDLPLVKTCFSITKKYNIRIIADLHENYPEAVKDWMTCERSFKARLFNLLIPVARWRKYEASILKTANKIITVADETVKHYVEDCGVSEENICVVKNTEDFDGLLRVELLEDIVRKYRDHFVVSYVGGFSPDRGLETALRASQIVARKINNFRLILVGGKGPKGYTESLQHLAKELNIEDYVEFTGWVDFKIVPSYISASSICLIPYKISKHTSEAIPHKLFQYMALGKPVVVTEARTLSRIIKNHNCGLVIPSEDHRALANCIIKLYFDKNLAEEMGLNGVKAVKEVFNWSIDSKLLISLYNEVTRLSR